MFKRVLTSIRDRVDGALAVSLISLDGIPVETVRGSDGVPLDVLGAEFGSFIKSIRPNTEIGSGEVLQFSLVTEKYITFLSAVTPDYYILLVLRPDGNYGRARFELARAKHLLQDELV